jgi:hypothetical protein
MTAWKRITIDAATAAALRSLAIAQIEGFTVLPSGDVAFLIDPEVATELESDRQPGEDDTELLRRIVKERAGIDVPRRRPN